jgi:hypothetical protein
VLVLLLVVLVRTKGCHALLLLHLLCCQQTRA